MKSKELQDLTIEELASKRTELSKEIFNLRVQQQSGQLEKPSTLKSLRRDIARVETIKTAKVAASAKG